MAQNEPVVQIAQFSGLRNSDRPERLQPGSLVGADNVNLDDTQTVERRDGYVKSIALNNVQSSYSPDDQSIIYLIDGGNLIRVDSFLNQTVLYSGIPNGTYYWVETGNDVIFSGPIKCIIRDNECYLFQVDTPPPPIVSTAEGSLYPGRYQVAIVNVRVDGAESASSSASVVDLQSNGALLIQSGSGRVYISAANGDVLYYAYETNGGSVLWNDNNQLSAYPLDPEQIGRCSIPDSTTVIAYHESRLWAADGNRLWRSEPYWLHLFNRDTISVNGEIRAIESTSQGLFIGTSDSLYILTLDEILTQLTDYGVPEGQPVDRDLDNGQLWIMTERGVCTYPPFQNLSEEKVSINPGTHVVSKILDQKGYKRLLSLVRGDGRAHNSEYSVTQDS